MQAAPQTSLPDGFGAMGTALLHDALSAQVGEAAAASCVVMTAGSLTPGSHCHGPAYTVTVRRAVGGPGSSSEFRNAYDLAPPGGVVVVSVVGDVGGAVAGDMVGHRLRALGVAGLVVDGDLRDSAALSHSGLAVWSQGRSMRGVVSGDVYVVVGREVRCGSATVHPGDIVVGDDDGVLSNPRPLVPLVHARARALADSEHLTHVRLEAGDSLAEALDRSAYTAGPEGG